MQFRTLDCHVWPTLDRKQFRADEDTVDSPQIRTLRDSTVEEASRLSHFETLLAATGVPCVLDRGA